MRWVLVKNDKMCAAHILRAASPTELVNTLIQFWVVNEV